MSSNLISCVNFVRYNKTIWSRKKKKKKEKLLVQPFKANIHRSGSSVPPGPCSLTYRSIPDTTFDIRQSLERSEDEMLGVFSSQSFCLF